MPHQPSTLQPLLVATGNRHKIEEIRRILEGLTGTVGLRLLSAADYPHLAAPEETGATFEENAVIKARAWAEATGRLTLADDSGLAVDALDGRPGIHSARYAASDAECVARVLREMEGQSAARRAARFECVMALADPRGGAATRRGVVLGRLTTAPRGRGGFGYDPIFELTQGRHAGRTTAELSADDKNSISHRSRALAAIAPLIVRSLAEGRVRGEG